MVTAASRPWWDDHDILVTPTSPEPPVRLGELAPTNPDPRVSDAHGNARRRSRCPFDVTGQPAISLPLHWNDDEPPDRRAARRAAYGREDVLLRVARSSSRPLRGPTATRRSAM